jgi:ElaB/YqjD/DUF883 family membrane-anchored ribosome-binding protein
MNILGNLLSKRDKQSTPSPTTPSSSSTTQPYVNFDLDSLTDNLYRVQCDLFVYHGDAEHEVNVLLKEFETNKTEERFDTKLNQINTTLLETTKSTLPLTEHTIQTHQPNIANLLSQMNEILSNCATKEQQSIQELNNKIIERRLEIENKKMLHQDYLASQRLAIDHNTDNLLASSSATTLQQSE